MATHNHLTPRQVERLGSALKETSALDPASIKGVSEGTNSSIWFVNGMGGEEFVIRIMETTDVHRNGMNLERAQHVPNMLVHMQHVLAERPELAAVLELPTPQVMQFQDAVIEDGTAVDFLEREEPYLPMKFPHIVIQRAIERARDLVEPGERPSDAMLQEAIKHQCHEEKIDIPASPFVDKVVYIVPRIRGEQLDYNGKAYDAEICYQIGAASAAWQEAASSYQGAKEIEPPFGMAQWGEAIAELEANRDKLILKMTQTMQGEWEKAKEGGAALDRDGINRNEWTTQEWRARAGQVVDQTIERAQDLVAREAEIFEGLPIVLNMGDNYGDNYIKQKNGVLCCVDNGTAYIGPMMDDAMGLVANALAGGVDNLVSAKGYMSGWQSISPMSERQMETLQDRMEIAEMRWALSRTINVLRADAKELDNMRSPEDKLQNIRDVNALIKETEQENGQPFYKQFAPPAKTVAQQAAEAAQDLAKDKGR